MTPYEFHVKAANIWKAREIPNPNSRIVKGLNTFIKMRDLCQSCGSDSHSTQRCCKPLTRCSVPHYGQVNYPPHSTLMCPVLHNYCQLCKLRGHRSADHEDRNCDRSPRQHRKTFMEFAHRGLFTLLPYLIAFPKVSAIVRGNNSRLMLHSNNMPRPQADIWLYLGLDSFVPKEFLDTQENRRITTTDNLTRSILAYETPDVFDKVIYLDDAPVEAMVGAPEAADWLD